ncbi:hypothetical protein OG589_00825 [Sphaerisporangium sp. NBC_01403]|uniref:hypothetical protein n=1 Tax=Sphaerisporangium sp. NBC_01403 TaxID=2903599 RepID=UPI0032522A4E
MPRRGALGILVTLTAATTSLGVPNKYPRWYANDLGKGSLFLTAPWCATFVAWAADEAGVRAKVGTDARPP